ELFNALKKQNIFARKYFYPIMTDLAIYQQYQTETPEAKLLSEHVLCLPMYPALADAEIQQIVKVIKMVANND
ncbi:DegT/DnrJ/EryC1/StrS family aminotransferase, partial [Acinetobacter sp.]|uniref:DegT/DnrJ/EryC1/StrS family aminotransferase n=1 Tax=Acinetobacter sp. TaxID=472 RepID=UPI002FCA1979